MPLRLQYLKSRFQAILLLASTLTLSVLLVLVCVQAPAQGSCIADLMDGRWENVDANTRGITHINYTQGCSGPRLCDTDGNCSTSSTPAKIHIFGACHPTDCDWGETEVTFYRNGEWRYGIYDQGFARKMVWMRLEDNGQLTVVANVDYRDNREDRSTWYRFNHL